MDNPLNPTTSRPWWRRLGLITGTPDDDPSGVAIYSQAGAHFGYGLLWTMPFSYSLMTFTHQRPVDDVHDRKVMDENGEDDFRYRHRPALN